MDVGGVAAANEEIEFEIWEPTFGEESQTQSVVIHHKDGNLTVVTLVQQLQIHLVISYLTDST